MDDVSTFRWGVGANFEFFRNFSMLCHFAIVVCEIVRVRSKSHGVYCLSMINNSSIVIAFMVVQMCTCVCEKNWRNAVLLLWLFAQSIRIWVNMNFAVYDMSKLYWVITNGTDSFDMLQTSENTRFVNQIKFILRNTSRLQRSYNWILCNIFLRDHIKDIIFRSFFFLIIYKISHKETLIKFSKLLNIYCKTISGRIQFYLSYITSTYDRNLHRCQKELWKLP